MATFDEVFNEIRTKLENLGYSFELTKSGAVSCKDRDGKKVKAKDLDEKLMLLSWSSSADEFLDTVKESLKVERQERTAHYRTDLKPFKLEFPERHEFHDLRSMDLKILKDIRICKGHSRGLLLLVRTGVDGVEEWKPIVIAQTEDGKVKRELDSILTDAPCDTAFIPREARRRVEKARQEHDTLKKLNPKRDEEGNIIAEDEDDFDEESIFEAEVRSMTENRPSRGTQLTRLLQNTVEQLSSYVRGCEKPTQAGEAVLKGAGSTLLMQSENLTLWGYTVTIKTEKETKTTAYAERFSLVGNFSDLVSERLDDINRCRALKMSIPPIISNDPEKPAFHYFDLRGICEQHAGNPTPAWDSFLRKMDPEDAEVFRAFIFAIFDAENAGRQMLYLYDLGYSGKSCVIKALYKALGTAAGALSQGALSNQFAFSKIWDKRLVVFSDNKDPNLARFGKIHQALGGDPVSVEYKGQDAIDAVMNAKFLCAGNIMLTIDTKNRSEASRVLPIKIRFSIEQMAAEGIIEVKDGKPVLDEDGEPVLLGDRTYADRLADELYAFIANSKDAYTRLCPTRCEIKRTRAMRELMGEYEDEKVKTIQAVFDEICEKDSESRTPTKDLKKAFSQALDEYDEGTSWGRITWADVKGWLSTRMGAHEKTVRLDGVVSKGYVGIRLKETCGLDGGVL